jgi:signal transduction histidine kinase
MNRWLRAGIGVSALGIGLALLPKATAFGHESLPGRLQLVAIGLAFVAAGLGAWARRPENRTGRLLVLAGFAWWMPLLEGTRVPLLFTFGSAFETAVLPVLFLIFLSFPEGRPATRLDRGIAIYSVLMALFTSTIFAPFYDPAAFGCPNCQLHLNLFLIHSDPTLVRHAGTASGWILTAGMVALILRMAVRWAGSTAPRRRLLAPILVPGATWSLAYLAYLAFQLQAVHELFAAPQVVYSVTSNTFLWSLLALPIAFLVGLTRYRARRARISDLVVELGELAPSDRLEDALKRTLSDPSLTVGFWTPDQNRYISAEGHTAELPAAGDARTVTFVERRGSPLAAIVHDPALLDDPALVDAVVAAARLALENERLQAEVRSQLEEVRASRARLVDAADEERRRVERDLHDGAQSRLISLSFALQVAQSRLGMDSDPILERSLTDASEELNRALSELRELARGIHPAVLTEAGLSAALEALAERAPIPVTVEEIPQRRLPARVEAAAYFVVAEAITNAAKHAAASEVFVRATLEKGRLALEISDDGMGGASVERGSGLRGLADRVQALGGEFAVTSPPAVGTSVVARIPCE